MLWVRFSVYIFKNCSITQPCLMPCDPVTCSTPGFPVLCHLPEVAQTHVCWVGGAIQPSHSLLPPFKIVYKISLCIYLFLALLGLPGCSGPPLAVARSGGSSPGGCAPLPARLLLSHSTGSGCTGFSSWHAWLSHLASQASEHRVSSHGAQA